MMDLRGIERCRGKRSEDLTSFPFRTWKSSLRNKRRSMKQFRKVVNKYLERLKEGENREPTRYLNCHNFNTRSYIKDRVRNEFSPLTKEEEDEVNNALSASDSKKVLVIHQDSNIKITKEDIRCLLLETWLNDEVINLYLELLKERENREPTQYLKCHFFNTFFYKKLFNQRGEYDYQAVKRWTTHKKLGHNLLDCDSILVPIHKHFHWTLAVINIKEKKIQYYDSLDTRDNHVFNVLTKYIQDEVEDKCRNHLNLGGWKHEHMENIPLQENGSDCGVFMLKYADFHSRGMPPDFTQANIEYYRRRMANEILKLRVE
ncbi:ubiquitin-like-specific protease ESD4 [Cryptomeria japonica]|uniref:ubiquitin-like-specific protease ESD4 n=1 Tax=Cryptomeria japonica TaxID=3369 RepID=UPI0027DA74B6|nr:ubiquitin-like-specific protease ESD4 [Cryptomeria japonica]